MRRSFPWLITLAFLAPASCDRDDLNSGPRITEQRQAEEPPPPPPPPPSDPGQPECPQEGPFRARINEVMVQNTMTIADEDGDFSPWIELYNPSDEEIILGGVKLSDDLTMPGKWEFPCTSEAIIPPGGYLLVWCDGETANPDDLHSSLTLVSPPFQPLQLALNGGTELVFFDVSFLEPDTSFGRSPDGGGITVLAEPTPGEPNPAPGGGPVEGPMARFIRGDVDANTRVNVVDVVEVLKMLFSSATPPSCRDRLDANDDGNVTLADPLYLSNALFIRGPALPAPFPHAGVDPTADALPCQAEE